RAAASKLCLAFSRSDATTTMGFWQRMPTSSPGSSNRDTSDLLKKLSFRDERRERIECALTRIHPFMRNYECALMRSKALRGTSQRPSRRLLFGLRFVTGTNDAKDRTRHVSQAATRGTGGSESLDHSPDALNCSKGQAPGQTLHTYA